MSTTKYEVFLKSAQLGNFTRAAEELNITQSGVSHTVASLEKELGDIAPGLAADFVVCGNDLRPERVFIRGEEI